MTWPHLLAIVLGGLAVLPVLYAFRAFTGRAHAPRPDADSGTFSDLTDFDVPIAAEERSAPLGPNVHRAGSRLVFGRSDRAGARTPEGRTPGVKPMTTFEYTIVPHRGSMRQEAPDLGGFTKVPLLLYDRLGNCVMVHRRLSLN